MEDALRQLLEDPSKHRHEHVSTRTWLETGDAQLNPEISESLDPRQGDRTLAKGGGGAS
jgi:hypothetical protein